MHGSGRLLPFNANHGATVVRSAIVVLTLPALVHCGGFTSECDNPNDYRVLAMVGNNVFERRDARIRCTTWSPGCSSGTSQPGTEPIAPPETFNCRCGAYVLEAEDFSLALPSAEVGTVVPLEGGNLTITKATTHSTTCAQGDFYIDYSGTFEGTIGGTTYRHGVFYALEVE
jgi:hypothetical protein